MDDDGGFADFDDDDFIFNDPRCEEEDEADLYLSTISRAPDLLITRPAEVVLGEPPNQSETTRKQRNEKRVRDENLPLGAHPLDWFANVETNTVEVKKRKVEAAQIRSENLMAKILDKKVQKTQTNPIGKGGTRQRRQRSPGTLFYEISDPDGVKSTRVEGGVEEKWQPVRQPTTTFFDDSILAKTIPTDSSEVITVRMPVHDSPSLWTEKYAPKSFLELLTSNEQNRNVLDWLNLWKTHVFGRKRPLGAYEDETRKPFFETEEQHPYLPKRRILVLYGPAGSGKSTLANICARQAGYRPIFLDACDLTNVGACKAKLADVISNVSMKSFVSKDRSPVCVVIESIDHANTDIINYFASSAAQKLKKNLTCRPIIMICNNFFQPNLRKLRSVCGGINVSYLDKQRAIERLENICALEDMSEVKRHSLIELFERYCGDMRRCLGNLHFLCSSTQISGRNSTRDDSSQHSIFEALDRVLTTNSYVEGSKILLPQERSRILANMLSRRTDADTLAEAVFHNLSVAAKLKIFQLHRIGSLFAEENLITSYIRQSQSYALMRYTNTSILLIHLTIATRSAKRLTYNLGFLKNREKVRTSEGILESLWAGLKPESRLSAVGFQTDLLPALLIVVQTNCPTSSTQLQHCTATELEAVRRVASVMTFHGLNYVASLDKTVGEFSFDPRLDEIVLFPTRNQFFNRTDRLHESTKKIVAQLLATQETEQKLKVTSVLQMPDQRIAGLVEVLSRGLTSRISNRAAQFTTTGFHYKQGNSTAIRCNARNESIFSVIIGK